MLLYPLFILLYGMWHLLVIGVAGMVVWSLWQRARLDVNGVETPHLVRSKGWWAFLAFLVLVVAVPAALYRFPDDREGPNPVMLIDTGMTVAEVRRAAGTPIATQSGPCGTPACESWDYSGCTVQFEGGRVKYLDPW